MASIDMWHSVTTNGNVVDKWFVLAKAVDLFGEAIRCFYAHANLACSICVCARYNVLYPPSGIQRSEGGSSPSHNSLCKRHSENSKGR